MSDTILVVEDDQDVRESVLESLADEGFVAFGSSDGAAALAHLRTTTDRPAVILLDLMMPNMNGMEFRQQQLRDPRLKDIPVVLLSADAAANLKASAMQAAGCLRKPVKLDALLEAVRPYVGR